jgi:hypothetical protein
MVIHNYDFTYINLCRFHNTLIMLSDAKPTHNIVFHLGHTPKVETTLLSCEEIQTGTTTNIYLPDVPKTTPLWTNTVKKQIDMILHVSQKHQKDIISVVVDGGARQEVAAIAIHQEIRDRIGVMYMIEFCMPDEETRHVYERTLPPIYRS